MRRKKRKNLSVEPAAAEPQPAADTTETVTVLKYRERKKKFGDRRDGRKLRTLHPMNRIMPYIMPKRSDALNTFYDRIDVEEAERLCRAKAAAGMKNITILHVLLAAYIRAIAARPGINRFISGQKVYARKGIVFVMTIKKEMSLSAPDTVIKVEFEPSDTLDDVYRKFNDTAEAALAALEQPTDFDNLMGVLNKLPGWVLRFFVWLLNKLDYHGHLPKSLLDVSPFHGSMIITSMGSLGINPIYHHIYDFGNLPVFLSYGTKKTVYEPDKFGNVIKRRFIDLKAVTDERICDGYYFASAFKLFKKMIEHPSILNQPLTELHEDID